MIIAEFAGLKSICDMLFYSICYIAKLNFNFQIIFLKFKIILNFRLFDSDRKMEVAYPGPICPVAKGKQLT